MAGCTSCGGRRVPYDPNRGVTGVWSVRLGSGALRTFADEDAARAYIAARPGRPLTLLEPAVPVELD